MSPDFMDKVCEECVREVENYANDVTIEPDPQCSRCNFLAIIKIEPYHKEMAERINHRIKHVLDVVLRPDFCLEKENRLYVEADLSDNVIQETCVFRFATAICNALNLVKSDEEFVTLKIYRGGSCKDCKDKDEPQYKDYGTSVSPLKIGGLAGFLQEKTGKGEVVGCVKIG